MTALPRRTVIGLLLALAPAAALAGAEDKPLPGFVFADADRCGSGSHFSVVNRGTRPIFEVYIRPSGTSGWGSDLLGDAVLAPGTARQFDPGPGIYDVLLLREDGHSATAMRQRVCALNRITLRSDGVIEAN